MDIYTALYTYFLAIAAGIGTGFFIAALYYFPNWHKTK